MVQSSALEKVGPELLTLYEVAEYDGDRRTLERAIDAMNSVNGEIETLIRSALQSTGGGNSGAHAGTQAEEIEA
jgi:hypothetical protein